ncbi:WD repeat protein, putative [Rhizoctonia solani AG-3 Rhs1AP]|uniref:WD repeat protein, putative n=1 Tax=Rhizoctonia solani AG-3 Rhs1AP TaxID=1086054 RepID=X8JSK2_9AGAM|nr:WD repeat protein, putative [Rhizoctonia solani AG-3 Rhs1AP]
MLFVDWVLVLDYFMPPLVFRSAFLEFYVSFKTILFDTGVTPYTMDVNANPFKRFRRRSSLGGPILRDSVASNSQVPSISQLPAELESLAGALYMFVNHLNDVPEFIDEAVHTTHRPVIKAFQAFADDLSYRADCLSEFKDKLVNVAFARHINELTDDLSTPAAHVSSALDGFIEVGIPAIRYYQERMADRLQNLSTVATFFSAVTATTIQVSVLTFLFGLCVFTYSSEQPPAVTIVVTSFTVLTSSALLCVGIWFASERWTYLRTQGSHWLVNILDERMDRTHELCSSILAKASGFTGGACDHLRSGRNSAIAAFSNITRRNSLRSPTRVNHEEEGTVMDAETQHSNANELFSIDPPVIMPAADPNEEGRRRSAIFGRGELSSYAPGTEIEYQARISGQEPTSLEIEAPASSYGQLSNPRVPNPISSTHPGLRASRWGKKFSEQIKKIKAFMLQKQVTPTRIKSVVPKLRTLGSAQSLSEHIAQVRHLRFSPDGRHLATCSWDRVTCIWKVDGASGNYQVMRQLVHTGNSEVVDIGQVAWSPNGEELLTKHRESIRIWSPLKDASCQSSIYRGRYVQSVAWMPSPASGFFSAEWQITPREEKEVHRAPTIQGSYLVRFVRCNVIDTYKLDQLQVWDLAVMLDEGQLVVVASLLKSQKNYKPTSSRHEKRILVYSLNTKKIEGQMPLMHDVRGVTLVQAGDLALVSYEGNAPPQTWYLNRIPDTRTQEDGPKYQIKLSKKFAGTSHFGAYKDTLVLAASKAGEIYIWERSSANLIHTLTVPSKQELTGLAWNPKSTGNKFTIASAMRNGMVNICTWLFCSNRVRCASVDPLFF